MEHLFEFVHNEILCLERMIFRPHNNFKYESPAVYEKDKVLTVFSPKS
jgi:hypothetical protein